MKILVAGDGKVGSALVRDLSPDKAYDLTLIDSNSKVLANAIEQYDIMAVTGNCATMDTLEDAGVSDADLLIAATSKDEINLLCCLTAYGLNPNLKTIARIRNPEYHDQTHKMKDRFGLSFMVNPDYQAAIEIERLLKYPSSLKREYFAKAQIEIVELMVDANSRMKNVQLKDLNRIVKCKVLVCLIMRDGKAFAPDGDCRILEGDRVYVTAPSQVLTTLLKNLNIISNKIRRVVVCGGNRISYYLANRLQKSGITVQIIEKDYNRCVELAGALPHASIVHGDASSQTLLKSEHIDQCDALITMTGLDELNMIISLYGSQHGVPQVITSIGHMAGSPIVDSLELGNIISPKELCSDLIVNYVHALQKHTGAAHSIHPIADGQAEALEFVVSGECPQIGIPLKNISLKKGVLIAGIHHEISNQTEIPNGNSSFQEGDILIVVTNSNNAVYQLNEIFDR